MTDHQAEVEELLAGYRRSREQLATVQRTLLSITESAASQDGLITATVDSAGTLASLSIAEDAYGRYRPAELADAVVRAARAAAAKAGKRAGDAMASVLPSGTDPHALLTGRADLPDEEIAPVEPTPAPPARGSVRARPVVDDDDSFEETSWIHPPSRGWSA